MKNNYPSAFYHAHMELVAVNVFALASILIMTCLIVDRYIFIFFPARIRSRNARKNVRSFIMCSFILGFAVFECSYVNRLSDKRRDRDSPLRSLKLPAIDS